MSANQWTAADVPTQLGNLAILTGFTSVLSYQVAFGLAGAGASVVLAPRDPSKAERTMASIGQVHTTAKLEFRILDTAGFKSVRAFAAQWREEGRSIDILLSAGISNVPERGEIEDGLERQFATNYLGHFDLAKLLLPSVAHKAPLRVVEFANLAHRRTHLHFDDLQMTRFDSPNVAYSQSKLAMLTFGLKLDRRLRSVSSPICATSAPPQHSKHADHPPWRSS